MEIVHERRGSSENSNNSQIYSDVNYDKKTLKKYGNVLNT